LSINLYTYNLNRISQLLGVTAILLAIVLFHFIYSSNTCVVEFLLLTNSSLQFPISLIFDKIRVRFSLLVTTISCSVFLFSRTYIRGDQFYLRFTWILLLFVLSMNFLIFAGSLFILLLGWDGLGIISFILIIYYQSNERLQAGYITLIVNRLGDVFIVSTFCLMVILGQFFIIIPQYAYFLVLLLLMARLTKSAQYPFSPWLPAAIAAPTPVRALVHSSTLVTAGIYLIIRIRVNAPLPSEILLILIFVGRVTCLLGGVSAIFENDLKKIVALSTLRQLGLIMFRLSLNLPYLALFHLYIHATFKALLFICVGNVLLICYGTQDIRLLGGVLIKSPILSVFFNIRSLCLVGAPFINAFYTKHVIIECIFNGVNIFAGVLIFIGSFFTAVYVIRTLYSINWSKMLISCFSVQINLKDIFPLILLGRLSVFLGKIYFYFDIDNLFFIAIPTQLNFIINLLFPLGVVFRVYVSYLKNSFIINTIFFTNPILNSISSCLFPISLRVSTLDKGWLYPNFIFKAYPFLTSFKISNSFSWPDTYLGFFRGTLIFFRLTLIYCML